ncbi:glycosyltransferase family 2 protein [Streptomyces sp. x-19]|uniref:glycosyltransferase family 2 protein n=1 Tax=Streptomyces sp. x-19 TaxID=2789280 RepID=UPI00397EBBF4
MEVTALYRTTADLVPPRLDEAAALPWALDQVPAGWRAIVVDNGSTDGTAENAVELGAMVMHEPQRGFGAACHTGLLAETAEFVCFCDRDASVAPALSPAVAGPVLDGSADLAVGHRRPVTRRAWPLHARLTNLEPARLIRRRTGLRPHDLGPIRAARRASLCAVDLTGRRSDYPRQMVRAADAGWRVAETEAPYRPRTGRSKVTGTWLGTWPAVRDMRAILAERPAADPVFAATTRGTGR